VILHEPSDATTTVPRILLPSVMEIVVPGSPVPLKVTCDGVRVAPDEGIRTVGAVGGVVSRAIV